MEFQEHSIYHIYNQGNNSEVTFKGAEDYLAFLKKVGYHLKPYCSILSYCLMPNYFHFIILTTEKSNEKMKVGSLQLTRITNAFRLILSEYAQDFNKKYRRTGSLFRQKTKYKAIEKTESKYLKNLIYDVLSHPFEGIQLVKLEDWHYSSFRDLLGLRKGKLIDAELCKDIFQLKDVDLDILNARNENPRRE